MYKFLLCNFLLITEGLVWIIALNFHSLSMKDEPLLSHLLTHGETKAPRDVATCKPLQAAVVEPGLRPHRPQTNHYVIYFFYFIDLKWRNRQRHLQFSGSLLKSLQHPGLAQTKARMQSANCVSQMSGRGLTESSSAVCQEVYYQKAGTGN